MIMEGAKKLSEPMTQQVKASAPVSCGTVQVFKSGLYPLLFISSVYLVLIKLKKCHKCKM